MIPRAVPMLPVDVNVFATGSLEFPDWSGLGPSAGYQDWHWGGALRDGPAPPLS